MNRRLFFGIGFAIWLLATIVFLLLGHLIFLHEEPPVLALIWVVTVIGLAVIAWLLLAYASVLLAPFLPAGADQGEST